MRSARKRIDVDALLQNYRYLKSLCPGRRVLAVVKSDAYGHGLARIAQTLSADAQADARVDGFAVATINEALALRGMGLEQTIVIMQGFLHAEEIRTAIDQHLTMVIHSSQQLALLEQCQVRDLALWVKFDTGMGRLGFSVAQANEVFGRMERLDGLSQRPVLMSHLGYADEPEMEEENRKQWRLFESLCKDRHIDVSMLNSAGLLASRNIPVSQWVRVGLALYGIAPVTAQADHARWLKPVMRVTAPVIAVRRHKAGDRIGYGGTYTCPRDMTVGIVGMGYGDGYPRHAQNGTPVWINGVRCELVGRVSMDMIAVFPGITSGDGEEIAVGDTAELWGPELSVAEVAGCGGTIAYELLCAAQKIQEENACETTQERR